MFKNNILKSLDYNKGHWDLANMRGWNRSRENPRMSLWTCPQNPLTSSEKIHPHVHMMPSLLGVKVKTPQHPANKVQIPQASGRWESQSCFTVTCSTSSPLSAKGETACWPCHAQLMKIVIKFLTMESSPSACEEAKQNFSNKKETILWSFHNKTSRIWVFQQAGKEWERRGFICENLDWVKDCPRSWQPALSPCSFSITHFHHQKKLKSSFSFNQLQVPNVK